MKPARAKCDTAVIAEEMIAALRVLRDHIGQADEAVSEAFASLETHVAISLRVFSKTNPSKLRDVARTVEIGYLMREIGK